MMAAILGSARNSRISCATRKSARVEREDLVIIAPPIRDRALDGTDGAVAVGMQPRDGLLAGLRRRGARVAVLVVFDVGERLEDLEGRRHAHGQGERVAGQAPAAR
jgi:hypothetical protein